MRSLKQSSLLRSYRFQLLALSAAAAAAGTLILSFAAYGTARRSIEDDALRAVSIAASTREESLLLSLRRQNERAASFLDGVLAICLEEKATIEPRACIERALASFTSSEPAIAARITWGGGIVDAGDQQHLESLPRPRPGELARVAEPIGGRVYPRPLVFFVEREGATLTLVIGSETLDWFVSDGGALGKSGEAFLVDQAGLFVTAPRHSSSTSESHAIEEEPMRRCLAGEEGETVSPDYRNVSVVHGFRQIPELGGACLMVHIDEAEALRPARALRRQLAVVGGLLTAISALVALAFARTLTGPLDRLTEGVRRFRAREDQAPTPVEGPTEVRTLAVSFREMALAVRRSRRAMEESAARSKFLGETTALLSASLDYVPTLRKLAHLSIPTLGDWCVVAVQRDGHSENVAAAHVDPSKEELARALEGRQLAVDLQVNRAIIYPDVEDATWVARELGAEHPELMRTLGARSYMIVPMAARERALGLMVFVSASRRFVGEDLDLAEQLARRAAIAIDNARLYEAAQRALRSRDDVLAVVSHDLKNPLNAIGMSAGLLLRRAPEGELGDLVRRHAELIERSSSRMRVLIDDLLDLAGLESGQLELSRALHDPRELVGEVTEVLQPLASSKGLSLSIEVPEGLPRVCVDKKRAYQVLANVVGNAVKYTPEKGRVIVEARPEAEHVVLAVIDNGPGIPADQLPRIFERYFKRGEFGGTGLGLYIARRLVEAQGGSIHVESVEGQGSTFTIALPTRGPDEARADR